VSNPTPTNLVTNEQAYRNFIEACRSPSTRYLYKKILDYFMSYLRIPQGEYSKLLEMDSKITQANIIDYVAFLKKSKSSASVMMYLSAIRKFYLMNDISLNWDRIHSYQGEHVKVAEDRPYTHSEVQQMISHTSVRNRAIILTLWSSGMRVGAIPTLRIKDLEPIEKYSIYKITVYAKSKRSSYKTYCSPECKIAIDQYLSWRSRWGDKLYEDEPLFRQDFNTSTPRTKKQQREIRSIKLSAIRWGINKLLRNTGIRSTLPRTESNPYPRSGIMMCHGLRKGFEDNAFKAGMPNIYIRRLLGQKSGLEDSYLKISDEELLEGDSKHVGYVGIIDQITIEDTHRLTREIQTLQIEKSKMEQVLERINKLEDEILNQ
jgi:integrase